MDALHDFLYGVIDIAAMILATLVLLGLVTVAVLYIVDVNQSEQAIRRNYPVIGPHRYFFEHMGEFFRQYFFALDREEMPFNRAIRSWVYRAAKGISTKVAFGSTRTPTTPGDIHFNSAGFALLAELTVIVLALGEVCLAGEVLPRYFGYLWNAFWCFFVEYLLPVYCLVLLFNYLRAGFCT